MINTKVLINSIVIVTFLLGVIALVFKFDMDAYTKLVKAVAEFLVPLIVAYGIGKGAQEVATNLKKNKEE